MPPKWRIFANLVALSVGEKMRNQLSEEMRNRWRKNA
jgi:hypothetical protein